MNTHKNFYKFYNKLVFFEWAGIILLAIITTIVYNLDVHDAWWWQGSLWRFFKFWTAYMCLFNCLLTTGAVLVSSDENYVMINFYHGHSTFKISIDEITDIRIRPNFWCYHNVELTIADGQQFILSIGNCEKFAELIHSLQKR